MTVIKTERQLLKRGRLGRVAQRTPVIMRPDPFFPRVFTALLLTRNLLQHFVFLREAKMTSRCGYNNKVAHESQLIFLPQFDVFCDILLYRHLPTCNLFVKYGARAQPIVNSNTIKNLLTSSIRQNACLIHPIQSLIDNQYIVYPL